jgi:hypothetical protein
MMGLLSEDDEDELLQRIAVANVTYMMGTMLLLRELGGAVAGFGYEGPAGNRAIAKASTFVAQATRAVSEGDPERITAHGWRALNEAAGAFLHYPADQTRRTLEGLQAIMEGKTSNPAAIFMGAPRE